MVKERLRIALSRARYAAIGAAVGAAVGGLFSRKAASTGGAIGALVGAFVGEGRITAQDKLDELRERREEGLDELLPSGETESAAD